MAKRGEITKRAVDALQPKENNDVFLWDGKISGFGVRCRPSGEKYYFLKMRAGKRQRWITIGKHGSPWTPNEAWSEALKLSGIREDGTDPAAEHDHIKENPTIKELGKLFITEHAKAKRKPRTSEEYERLLTVVVNPKLGKVQACDLSHADVADLHFKLRSTPYQANRVVAVLKKMCNWARKRGVRPKDGANPAQGIELYKEHKRKLFLSEEPLAKVGHAIRELLEDGKIDLYEAGAIREILFTGCRKGEILPLKWEYLDFARGVAHLPDLKTGEKTVQLSPPALSVLSELPRVKDNPYVFISPKKKGSHLVNLQKPWIRIRRKAGLENIRIHDLRHAYGSMGAVVGFSLPIIGALLGHTQPSTTQRYAHVQNDPLKAAANAIASRLEAALEREPEEAKLQEA
jgi:integrase